MIKFRNFVAMILGIEIKEQLKENKTHEHIWKLEYRTGNPEDGKSEVCSCECGQWSVRHYGQADRVMLDKNP